jgi:hypothetical protein
MPTVAPLVPSTSGKHYNLDNVMTIHTALSVKKSLMAQIDAEATERKVSRERVIHDIIEKYYQE